MMSESDFIIDGPQPEQDLSYSYTEKCPDLRFIQKGVKLKSFRDNMTKRNLEWEFKLLRRLTENQLFMNQFRDYNPEIVKLDRYNQVMPFKHTMVKLPQMTTDGNETETYINANYISSSRKTEAKAFICTQGPLETTRGHFWRMIWHNHVSLVIMLCKCKENGKSQSDQYWTKADLIVDNFQVSLTEETEVEGISHLTKRVFTIKNVTEEGTEPQIKTVTHYQWVGWPDHGVPTTEDEAVMGRFSDFIYHERTVANPGAPVVIHCSAGIGRSGTLVAIYNLDLILRESLHDLDKTRLSVFGVVRRLREQRWGMVNTWDQYAFIYRFVADRIDKYLKDIEQLKVSDKPQEQ